MLEATERTKAAREKRRTVTRADDDRAERVAHSVGVGKPHLRRRTDVAKGEQLPHFCREEGAPQPNVRAIVAKCGSQPSVGPASVLSIHAPGAMRCHRQAA